MIEAATRATTRSIHRPHFRLVGEYGQPDPAGRRRPAKAPATAWRNTITGNNGNNVLDGERVPTPCLAGWATTPTSSIMAATSDGERQRGQRHGLLVTHYRLSANVENLVLQGGADAGLRQRSVGNRSSARRRNLLDGGAGANSMFGGAGNDAYFVDNVGDPAIENADEGIDAVFSSADIVCRRTWNTWCCKAAPTQGYGNGLWNAIVGTSRQRPARRRRKHQLDVWRGRQRRLLRRQCRRPRSSRTLAKAPTRCSRRPISVCGRTSKTWCCKAAPVCRATATAGRTRSSAPPATICSTARPAPTPSTAACGNDVYFVDNAGDLVFENLNEGNDAVFASVNYALAANVDTLMLQGTGSWRAPATLSPSSSSAMPARTGSTGAAAPTAHGRCGRRYVSIHCRAGRRRHGGGF